MPALWDLPQNPRWVLPTFNCGAHSWWEGSQKSGAGDKLSRSQVGNSDLSTRNLYGEVPKAGITYSSKILHNNWGWGVGKVLGRAHLVGKAYPVLHTTIGLKNPLSWTSEFKLEVASKC